MEGGGAGVDGNALAGTAPIRKSIFEFGDARPVVSQPEQRASTTELTSASEISCLP